MSEEKDLNVNINSVSDYQQSQEICNLASQAKFDDSPHELPHPFDSYEDFSHHPPIPIFNYIIDNKTGEIIEDKTGQA